MIIISGKMLQCFGRDSDLNFIILENIINVRIMWV